MEIVTFSLLMSMFGTMIFMIAKVIFIKTIREKDYK